MLHTLQSSASAKVIADLRSQTALQMILATRIFFDKRYRWP